MREKPNAEKSEVKLNVEKLKVKPNVEKSEVKPDDEVDVRALDNLIGIPVKLEKEVPRYRRCPLCYDKSKGVGICYHTSSRVRYYKCRVCRLTWKHTLSYQELKLEADFLAGP